MNAYIKREQDYAIRICILLARLKNKHPLPISVLAEKLFISRPIATKIVYHLKLCHIIETVRGKQGGVILSVKPAKLSLLRILRSMGFDSEVNQCVRTPAVCPFHGTCRAHCYFKNLNDYLIRSLSKKTIAHFIKP